MATYLELETLRNDSELFAKVRVATWIAAETVRNESDTTANHTNRLVWAKDVFSGEQTKARQIFFGVIAANKDQTLSQITGASDAAIQTAVDAVVDLFAA